MAKVMKSTDSSSLAEVVDRILDKGIVIDAWVKVSLVGIELLSIEARIVVASVETYLKYAEAIGLTATAAAAAAYGTFEVQRTPGEVTADHPRWPSRNVSERKNAYGEFVHREATEAPRKAR